MLRASPAFAQSSTPPSNALVLRVDPPGAPSDWFRGGLTDLFSDVLNAQRTRQRGYFEPRFVDRLVREHLGGTRDHTDRLWQLLVFELWHREYLDSAAVPGLGARVLRA